jgi:hypothetical protein
MEGAGTSSNELCDYVNNVVCDLIDQLSNRDIGSGLGHLVVKLTELRDSGVHARELVSVGKPRSAHRHGWVLKAVIQVLSDSREPMRARDIHRAVEGLLGESVGWSSVKMALASNVSGSSPRFIRIARGRYVLSH